LHCGFLVIAGGAPSGGAVLDTDESPGAFAAQVVLRQSRNGLASVCVRAVLCELVRRPGQLVTKDALLWERRNAAATNVSAAISRSLN